jgi:hypothetical protein
VIARNSVYWGVPSAILKVVAAQAPYTPIAPVTSLNGNNVVVTWTAPRNGGFEINGYRVYLLKNDGVTYAMDFTNCDGSNA